MKWLKNFCLKFSHEGTPERFFPFNRTGNFPQDRSYGTHKSISMEIEWLTGIECFGILVNKFVFFHSIVFFLRIATFQLKTFRSSINPFLSLNRMSTYQHVRIILIRGRWKLQKWGVGRMVFILRMVYTRWQLID